MAESKPASYLATVKAEIKEVFDAAFEELWRVVVEPALKQSYRNGVEAGKGGPEPQTQQESKGRRFSRQKGGAS